jgi:hypothetical protein
MSVMIVGTDRRLVTDTESYEMWTLIPPPKAIPQEGRAVPDFFSIGELATRWRCSRGTVYNRLRAVGAKVLDFATAPGKRSKKAVSIGVVLQIENRKTKALC